MDENLFHYHLQNQQYQRLLRESAHARVVACLQRFQRRQEGVYPPWLAALLVRLSQILISAGSRLQENLARSGSLPQAGLLPQAGESPHQYSYGD